MIAAQAPPASAVPRLLGEAPRAGDIRDAGLWARRLIGSRGRFGVTRIGSLTGLDRIGIPVAQAVRPLALTNAVSQGKGRSAEEAAISALMEAIEGYAAETIAPEHVIRATARSLGGSGDLYRGWLEEDAPADWEGLPLDWLEGFDLVGAAAVPAPLALVDTVYTLPSPHPRLFPRTTTGLAAGRSFAQAFVHAGLEILERDAIAASRRVDILFMEGRTAPPASDGIDDALARICAGGLVCGFWQAHAAHGLPVYACHVMEGEAAPELVPLPAEGFACGFTHAAAALGALLEACQGRATAIAGAREDITRQVYPDAHDRRHLAEWRDELAAPQRWRMAPAEEDEAPGGEAAVAAVVDALRRAGARAVIVVPLLHDEACGLHVVRVLAPPLRPDPGA